MREIRKWAAAFVGSISYTVWLLGSATEFVVHWVVEKSIYYLGTATCMLDSETFVLVATAMLKTVEIIRKRTTGKEAKEI